MRSLTLHIEGMSCGHCLNAVNQALGRLKGVAVKSVQLGRADLEYDEDRIALAAIVAAVADEGYPSTPREGPLG